MLTPSTSSYQHHVAFTLVQTLVISRSVAIQVLHLLPWPERHVRSQRVLRDQPGGLPSSVQ